MRTTNILALLGSSLTLPSVLALPVPQFAPQNTPQNDDLLKPIPDAMNELLGSNNGFDNGNKADGNASANKVGNDSGNGNKIGNDNEIGSNNGNNSANGGNDNGNGNASGNNLQGLGKSNLSDFNLIKIEESPAREETSKEEADERHE